MSLWKPWRTRFVQITVYISDLFLAFLLSCFLVLLLSRFPFFPLETPFTAVLISDLIEI